MRYTKYFPEADEKRWYIELVLHGKKDWDEKEAWRRFMFTSEDELLEYHEFAGCHLKTLREEGEYRRSLKGRIDIVRDEMQDLKADIDQCRRGYTNAQANGYTNLMEFEKAHAEWLKELLAEKEQEFIKLMSGRK